MEEQSNCFCSFRKNLLFFIHGVMWRSGLFYHDCTKNKVKITDHSQFTWYCKKCNEPW